MKLRPKPKYLNEKYGLCRPYKDATDVQKLNEHGLWVADDGQPGYAFSGRGEDGFPYAWYGTGHHNCSFSKVCACNKATHYTTDRFGAANGREMPTPRPNPAPIVRRRRRSKS